MAKMVIKKDFATRKKVEWWHKLQASIPDPDKIFRDSGHDFDVYRSLLNDPHLWAVVQQRKAQINQMGWTLNIADDDPLKGEILEMFENLGVNKHIDQILDSVLFGFDVEEVNWEIIENKYRPIALNQKPVDWFIFDKNNELRLRKMIHGGYVFEEGTKLPNYKFILSQHKPSYINPYGEKLLSKVYWSVMFKKAAVDNWEQLLAKHGMPYIVGRYPSTATEDDKNELEDAITEMLDHNLAMMNNDVEIDFKEGGKFNIGTIYENMVDFLNREISKACLTVTLTTELGSTGSYKAVEIHRKMLEMIGLQDKKIVERALSKLIEYYIDINHGKRSKYPEMRLEKKEEIVEATVERDKILTEMGIEFTKDYYRKRYNLGESDFVIKEKLKIKNSKGKSNPGGI